MEGGDTTLDAVMLPDNASMSSIVASARYVKQENNCSRNCLNLVTIPVAIQF